jgi:dienelactone hydrolase
MAKESIDYESNGEKFRGYFAYDEKVKKKRPAVIVAHAWRGQDDFARKKAEFLSELGYVGFAADLYGNGKTVETNDEAAELMTPLFIDRKTLRDRIVAAYHVAAKHEQVDSEKIGAIGFCFGGLTVIELIRSGVNLKGVVSFHGLLGNVLGKHKAKMVTPASKMHGSLLILHGYQDPMVSKEDIDNTQREFSNAKVDWQMHIYGEASHAFTNPIANDPQSGMLYHPRSEQRSLQAMQNFFNEVFE